jgi:glutamine synthetase
MTGSAHPGWELLRRQVAQNRVDTVLLAVPDHLGRLKGKRHDARHFLDAVAADGAEMCAYVLATDMDMRPLDGFALTSLDVGYGDLRTVPDPGTVRLVPWMRRTVLVHADTFGTDGQPIPVAPRQMLRRQLGLLSARGLQAKVGIEAECVLFDDSYQAAHDSGYQGLRPLTWDNLDYALDHPPRLERFLNRLQTMLAAAALPVETLKTEAAAGQVEITFPYGDPMAAADGHLVLKHAMRALGQRAGISPTFMAAPAVGVASGCHLHLSLWREDRPVMADTGHHPSALTLNAIAGLLTVLPHLAPLHAPTVNSYKRYRPDTCAPINHTWGHDNRTCAIRVVGHGDSLHLEIRLPGADANPYLALTAALAAVQYGIDQRLQPPPPCPGNAYQDTHTPPVPRSLQEALQSMRDSPLPARLLGKDVAEHYTHAAQIEVDAHHEAITDAELRRGFARA